MFKQTYPLTPASVPVSPQSVTNATGASGTVYQFQLHLMHTAYYDRPGVYIFVKRAANGGWDAVYIGETGSFKRRLSDDLRLHHQWDSVVAHGATHIATLHVPGPLANRENIETDLRRAILTPCNAQ